MRIVTWGPGRVAFETSIYIFESINQSVSRVPRGASKVALDDRNNDGGRWDPFLREVAFIIQWCNLAMMPSGSSASLRNNIRGRLDGEVMMMLLHIGFIPHS